MYSYHILSDASANQGGDLLHFKRYVDPLVAILNDPNAQTPFTIGLFGPWGGGKTSLLRMINEALDAQYPGSFLRVNFNPWYYQNEDNMLVPLLHTLNDTLNQDKKRRFTQAATRVGRVLTLLGSDILLKKLTSDVLSVDKLSSAVEALQGERQQVQSEIRNLRTTLQSVADEAAEKGVRLVILIDDLDRCDPAVIIDVLEATKLFFDLRHTFLILAVDKEIVDRGIEVKYGKFKFASGRESAIGSEYLEKMVQLPLYLFPLHPNQVRGYMDSLQPSGIVHDHLDLFQEIVLPNPRKIKRILNITNVTNAIIQASPALQEMEIELVVRLVVIQVQSNELYAQIVSLPQILLALEAAYKGQKQAEVSEGFYEYGENREKIQQTVQLYYHPESYLRALFRDSDFKAHESSLTEYLTLLGG